MQEELDKEEVISEDKSIETYKWFRFISVYSILWFSFEMYVIVINFELNCFHNNWQNFFTFLKQRKFNYTWIYFHYVTNSIYT